ncbi:hypothetical protein BC834DRAFT_129094 [Gloeopeniophorella convolvens]|nr:hypothetical protein BC834DRAFT_129094 [Gloeopeniophorella convolvens]
MTDAHQDVSKGWLQDDNAVLVSALAAVTVATGSVLLWRGRKATSVEGANTPGSSTPTPSALHTALASLHLSSLLPPARVDVPTDAKPEAIRDIMQLRSEQNMKEKSSRSKERRRRGKDPMREFSKGGKKYKELVRQMDRPPATSSEDLNAPPTEQGQLLSGPPSRNVSRSPSARPPSSRQLLRDPSDDPPAEDDTPKAHSEAFDDAASQSSTGTTDLSASVEKERSEAEPRPLERPEVTLSEATLGLGDPIPKPSTPPASSESSASHLPAPSWGSNSFTEASSSSSATSSPSRKGQEGSRSRVPNGSWDWDGQSTFHRDPPPRFAAARAANQQRGMSSPTSPSIPFAHPETPPTPASVLSPLSPLDLPIRRNGASPVPSSRPGARRTSAARLPPTPPPNPVSAQTQIASLKGALEAARLREEKNRAEAERLAKECDALRWHWAQDVTRWQHHEAKLLSYIQHLTHGAQMYAGAPPFSPATTPMLPGFPTSGLSGSVGPVATPLPYSPAFDDSRGRRRERGQENGANGDSDTDAFTLSDEVVGAILKRPDSLKGESQMRRTPPNEEGPLRFPSLSDLGNVWHEKATETATPSVEPAEDAITGIREGDDEETPGDEDIESVSDEIIASMDTAEITHSAPHDCG